MRQRIQHPEMAFELQVRVVHDHRQLIEAALLLADPDRVLIAAAIDGLRAEQRPAIRIEDRLRPALGRQRFCGST